jgi:hypothetical protein
MRSPFSLEVPGAPQDRVSRCSPRPHSGCLGFGGVAAAGAHAAEVPQLNVSPSNGLPPQTRRRRLGHRPVPRHHPVQFARDHLNTLGALPVAALSGVPDKKIARTSSALLVRGLLEKADGVINLVADKFAPLTIPVHSSSRDWH